jgi:hypothetical protein
MTPDFSQAWRYVQLPAPTAEPTNPAYVTLAFNPAWLPAVLGSLLTLLQQSTWQASDQAAANDLVDQATNLLAMLATAADAPATLTPISNGSPTRPFIGNGAGAIVMN